MPNSILDCDTCLEIIKTKGLRALGDQLHLDDDLISMDGYLYMHDYYFKSFDFELGRPRLELYIYEPHVCCLQNLKKIQRYYDNKWISTELFDEWMAVNGGDYQLGRSGRIDYLWNLRRDYLTSSDQLVKQLADLVDVNCLKDCPILVKKCKRHHHIFHVEIKKCKMTRTKIKILNKMFPFSSEADKKKTNLDLASLVNYSCLDGLWTEVNRAFELLPLGTYNSVAAAVVIHSIGNKHFNRMQRIILKDRACCLSSASFCKYLKTITTALRRTSRWPNGEHASLEMVAMCAYWEQCLGRSQMLSDWDKEKANRTTVRINLKLPLVELASEDSNKDYLVQFDKALDKIMEELIPSAPQYKTFKEFCENRQSWLSSGSSGGEQIMINDKGIRINKRTYFEGVPIDEMAAWLEDEPIMQAVASEKFEQSKARAIYGTKPKDYAIMAFAMMQAESNLFRVDGLEGGLVGSDEMRSIMRRVKLFKDNPNLEGLMIDYADFNIQHTLEAQAHVFDAMIRRLTLLNVKGDIIKALKWCSDCCLNQWVKFPNDTCFIRSVQGLFSGNRATNYINTINNVGYFRTAKDWVDNNLSIKADELYNLHQGDDVWIAFKNRLWGVALYAVMKNSGFVFQNEKQLQDKSRGEFLRVLYSEEGAMGYVARSIGTFLLRPLQGEDDISPDARCTALNSQIMILSRRGLSNRATKIIWDATIRHATKSSLPSGDTFNLPLKAVYRNYLDGGLDIGPPGTMCARSTKIAPVPTIQYESPELFNAVARHTTDAWIRVISEKYKDSMDTGALGDLLHRINTSDSLRPLDKQRCLSILHKQLRKWAVTIKEAPFVARSYMIWDNWLSSKCDVDVILILTVKRQFDIISIKRDFNTSRTRVETIISAISSSPFKDIASAERALHLGKINSARTAIKCSRNSDLAQEAIQLIDAIERNTSKQVLSRVISGVRGIGGTFEYKIHPIIMSWMNKICLDKALTIALFSNISKIDEWDDLLFHWQNMGVRCLLNNENILTISNY